MSTRPAPQTHQGKEMIEYCASTFAGYRDDLLGAQSAGNCVETALGQEWARPWAHHGGRPSSTAWQGSRTGGRARVLASMRNLCTECSMPV